jgi:hypothetical protein
VALLPMTMLLLRFCACRCALTWRSPTNSEQLQAVADSSAAAAAAVCLSNQCLQVYADLEESNLFLIQVCQESEEQLEEIRGHCRCGRSRNL